MNNVYDTQVTTSGKMIDTSTFNTDMLTTLDNSAINCYTTPLSYTLGYTLPENFDLQIKQVKNGFKCKINSDEFVFESIDGLLKFVKESFKAKK